MGNYCVSHVPLLLPILPPLYHISQVIPYIISRYPQIGKCLPSHWVAAHPNQLEPGWKSPHNKKKQIRILTGPWTECNRSETMSFFGMCFFHGTKVEQIKLANGSCS